VEKKRRERSKEKKRIERGDTPILAGTQITSAAKKGPQEKPGGKKGKGEEIKKVLKKKIIKGSMSRGPAHQLKRVRQMGQLGEGQKGETGRGRRKRKPPKGEREIFCIEKVITGNDPERKARLGEII